MAQLILWFCVRNHVCTYQQQQKWLKPKNYRTPKILIIQQVRQINNIYISLIYIKIWCSLIAQFNKKNLKPHHMHHNIPIFRVNVENFMLWIWIMLWPSLINSYSIILENKNSIWSCAQVLLLSLRLVNRG